MVSVNLFKELFAMFGYPQFFIMNFVTRKKCSVARLLTDLYTCNWRK